MAFICATGCLLPAAMADVGPTSMELSNIALGVRPALSVIQPKAETRIGKGRAWDICLKHNLPQDNYKVRARQRAAGYVKNLSLGFTEDREHCQSGMGLVFRASPSSDIVAPAGQTVDTVVSLVIAPEF